MENSSTPPTAGPNELGATRREQLSRPAPGQAPGPTHARRDIGFWSLILTQFQGAFNDNALKFLILYTIIAGDFPVAVRDRMVMLTGALFAIPFLLFSLAGGYLADRYSKRSVTIGTKILEFAIMLFATGALASGNFPAQATAVFLMSAQSALFGPSKYGLLPEILPDKDLSWGNGVLELGTFAAAIAATISGGYLATAFRGRQLWSGVILLGFTCMGLVASFGISRLPARDPGRKFRLNPFADLAAQLGVIRSDRLLSWAVAGNVYLWFLAALMQFAIVIYGHDVLGVDETQIAYLQGALGIGIGIGSLAAGYFSRGAIEYGLVPLGGAGMALFGFLAAREGIGIWEVRTELAALGFFGGFYAVPLNALIQHRPAPEHRGGAIAAANLLSFAGIFLSAGFYYFLSAVALFNAAQVFRAGAVLSLAWTLIAVALQPDSLSRLFRWARGALPV